MKKKLFFPFFILILFVVLHYLFVPKVIFINQSGRDLQFSNYYVKDLHEFIIRYGEVDYYLKSDEFKLNEPVNTVKNDQKIRYPLGWFSNRGSFFWASWSSIDGNKKNKMELAPEDFGWKDVIFIIDENGDYHKKTD